MEFSCCHAFEQCNYGREECVFAVTEPNKKERCRCYRIKHEQPFIKDAVGVSVILEKVEKVKQEIAPETFPLEQLSLF